MENYQAIVVVIRDGEDPWEQVAIALGRIDDVQFVGEPWNVTPLNDGDEFDAEFGTLEAIDQHPEK